MNGVFRMAAPPYPVDPQDMARAGLYGLIGRLFYAAPDEDLLSALAEGGELDAEAADAALPAAWRSMRGAARMAAPELVRAEYDAIFVGVGKPEVMLYGSYYLTGFLNEKPLVELRSELAELGYARRFGVSEPEDHIAGMADVMRHLILDEAHAPAEREAAQQQFFTTRLEPWYGPLCEAIEAVQGADFYRSVAGFTRAFLNLERDFLRMA